MDDQAIKKIVIVGGGTAGWIAAAALSHYVAATDCKIVLVEADTIGTIGVGEATVPSFINFLHGIGIPEKDFVKKTNATFKLGIQFRDWLEPGRSFFHPFGRIGAPIGGVEFFQCWLRSSREKSNYDLMQFSPSASMAHKGRFYPPGAIGESSVLSNAFYALHFDAALVAKYLRGFAESKGVSRVVGEVTDVTLSPETGFIDSVATSDGTVIRGDFFIDCSGFKALLIGDALSTDYDQWDQYLPCNRAIALQTDAVDANLPFTVASARDAGWTWQIPLQSRTGNGYVFSSDYCSDDEALSLLMSSVNGKAIAEPRIIPFATGMRREIWKRNCLSLGLSSGFLEPLESTAIHLITRTLQFFLRMFPDKLCSPALVKEFNRRIRSDYLEIRDFIVLHYCTSRRNDSRFWRDCRSRPIPDTLTERLSLFAESGLMRDGLDELFTAGSWQSICTGMDVVPRRHQVAANYVPADLASQLLHDLAAAIDKAVDRLPSHAEFIKQELA